MRVTLGEWKQTMSGAEFTLTSHEVMRGIKVRNGRLQLRPTGLVLFNTALDVLATTIAAVAALVAGGWWALIALPALVLLVDSIQRLRVAVIAGPDRVVIRNRRRRRIVPISEFGVATVESVQWLFRQPVYVFHGWWPGREYEVGVVRTTRDERIECDALVTWPDDHAADPTPVAMKVSALERWIAVQRAEGL